MSCIGLMRPVMPRIIKMLNTFDPNTLPMAIPLCPLRADTTLVASSGIEVPPAMMVRPITASLTPIDLAITVAESTNRLLPKTRQPKPNSRKKKDFGRE